MLKIFQHGLEKIEFQQADAPSNAKSQHKISAIHRQPATQQTRYNTIIILFTNLRSATTQCEAVPTRSVQQRLRFVLVQLVLQTKLEHGDIVFELRTLNWIYYRISIEAIGKNEVKLLFYILFRYC